MMIFQVWTQARKWTILLPKKNNIQIDNEDSTRNYNDHHEPTNNYITNISNSKECSQLHNVKNTTINSSTEAITVSNTNNEANSSNNKDTDDEDNTQHHPSTPPPLDRGEDHWSSSDNSEDNGENHNKKQRQRRKQKKKNKMSINKKEHNKESNDIPMQPSPAVRQRNEKFIPHFGSKEFRGKTPRKQFTPRKHSRRKQSIALKEIRQYQKSTDLLLQKLPF